MPPPLSLSTLTYDLLPQGVVGTENSLKSALVTAFSDGELDLEGDERGKHFHFMGCGEEGGRTCLHVRDGVGVLTIVPFLQMAGQRQS